MSELPLERLLPEQDFIGPLRARVESFELVRRSLLRDPNGGEDWTRRHYFRVYSEAEALEGFLDDYGARYNRTFHFLTELVASLRGVSHAACGLQHVVSRFDGYGLEPAFGPEKYLELRGDILRARGFLRNGVWKLLEALGAELDRHGALPAPGPESTEGYEPAEGRVALPRNMGQEDPVGEEQRIAEVVTKYQQACGMLAELGVSRIEDGGRRQEFLDSRCSEERCRVYEATVHNLQSAYDTFIKNTVIEARDERLPRLRGHASVALHLLEVATQLTHFVERHEAEERSPEAAARLGALLERSQVQEITLNVLLYWADRVMQAGLPTAEDLLPNYIDLQELEVDLDGDIVLHARPASLIVGIVNHHGTAVEMEVSGEKCNAGSILEVMVTVGTHPEARRFRFCGDQQPLRDIKLLFEFGLGERGLEALPDELDYLRRS